jgi:6-phosphogluconate dehydrogenase
VCAYNRTTDKVDRFLANEALGTNVVGAHSIQELCSKLKKPRRVMMLVKVGLVPYSDTAATVAASSASP